MPSAHGPLDDALTLPIAAEPAPRPALPIVSALLPVVGAVGLWAVTGSLLSLWFAALGPLLAGGAALDGVRSSRRDRRHAQRRDDHARAETMAALADRHAAERERLRGTHPDIAGYLAAAEEIWRTVPGRSGHVVVGVGERASSARVTGGATQADAALRARAAVLTDAPVTVPAGGGIAVVGPPVVAAAVARGLVLQLCLASPPGDLRVVGAAGIDGGWSVALPHRHAPAGTAVQLCPPGEAIERGVDAPIAVVRPGTPPPPRCAAVLTLTGLTTARLDHDGRTGEVTVELVGRRQAAAIAAVLQGRAGALAGGAQTSAGQLDRLLPHAPVAAHGTLPAVIGRDGEELVVVDLVVDGPHAVVTGVTGAGKSELLTTWIAALCATHTTAQVAFLLADFKGGRAFDRLAALPHVTGVLTDLDEVAAHRAIESLRAELRHRERVLASLSARDVDEAGDALPRLVIVVDEYAALVGSQPGLHDVFADIAARGRALGMHLILAGQRAGGVFRDALLANCPLRITLRVTDAADSRLVIGTDDAVALPGDPAARGIALVRRAADRTPRSVHVAVCGPATIEALAAANAGPPPRRPWLPELPTVLPLARLTAAASGSPGVLLLGLADEPQRQRQRPATLAAGDRGLLVVGGPGSGKTGVLRVVAAQHDPARTVLVPRDAEGAWDAVCAFDDLPAGTLVLLDDVDALAAPYAPDHQALVFDRVEALARECARRGIRLVATAQRLTGVAARLAPLLPRRALLSLPTRADHVAAGGEASRHRRDLPPGRGLLDDVTVQFAVAAAGAEPPPVEVPLFVPTGLTGLVTPPSPTARAVRERWASRGAEVLELGRQPLPEHAGAIVLWGEAEAWLREWRLLQAVRASGALVIDAACGGDVRAVTGSRVLPPYAAPGCARAWVWDGRSAARRVRLQ